MSLAEDFADLLPDTITVRPTTSRNSYGEPVSGLGVNYKARVMHKTQVSFNDRGEEKQTQIYVIVATAATIPHDAKVTLPDASEHEIWSVTQVRDDNNAVHHSVLRF